MPRSFTALVLLVAIAPLASAGGGSDCVEPIGDVVCADLDALAAALERHVANVEENATHILEAATDQPGLFVIDTAHRNVCSHADNIQCRIVSGRPLTGGIFELCTDEPRLPGSVPFAIWTAGQTADDAGRTATRTLFPGTPLEGESLCHDHWTTLRAFATLP